MRILIEGQTVALWLISDDLAACDGIEVVEWHEGQMVVETDDESYLRQLQQDNRPSLVRKLD